MSGRDTFQTEKGRNTSTILKMIHRAQIYMMTTIKNQTFRRRPCICFFFLTPFGHLREQKMIDCKGDDDGIGKEKEVTR